MGKVIKGPFGVKGHADKEEYRERLEYMVGMIASGEWASSAEGVCPPEMLLGYAKELLQAIDDEVEESGLPE